MDRIKISISKVENAIYQMINKKVSDNVFVGGLPSAIDSSLTDMVDINCSNAISDLHSHGYGYVLIFLYAKPRQNGSKNVAILNKMEDKLYEAIKKGTYDGFEVDKYRTYSDYDNTRNLYCNIVQLTIKIY